MWLDGPGHTRLAPISIADNSRIELAKIVVSTAILLLTLKIRFENLFDRFFFNGFRIHIKLLVNRLLFISYGLQKAKNENIDRGVTVYSDGLRLEDLVKGTDEPTIGTVGSGYFMYVCVYVCMYINVF